EVATPFLDPRLDRVGHRAEEHGHSRSLGPEQPLRRYEPEAEVLNLVEQRVVGRAHERLVHLERRGREPVANDLGRDDVDGGGRGGCGCHRAPSRSRTRSPRRSARTLQRGGTTIVVVHSSMIAGPSTTWSRGSCSRSNTGLSTKPPAPRK